VFTTELPWKREWCSAARLGTARHGLPRLETARSKHRFPYCCVACLQICVSTIAAWRKHVTLYSCSKNRGPSDRLQNKQEVLRRTNHPTFLSLYTEYLIRSGSHRKHNVFYCCVCILCRGKVFIEPMPSTDRGRHTDSKNNFISLFFFFKWGKWAENDDSRKNCSNDFDKIAAIMNTISVNRTATSISLQPALPV
jgi:hypothetical protein